VEPRSKSLKRRHQIRNQREERGRRKQGKIEAENKNARFCISRSGRPNFKTRRAWRRMVIDKPILNPLPANCQARAHRRFLCPRKANNYRM
jgi:hypothetical protein